ncbi:hypothetical protein [Halobacillus andaensis]|uniref:hypothetical protein n=1 Tax=Halobacillus andaensis TaxID=1176239 RepID=UPI003D706EBE
MAFTVSFHSLGVRAGFFYPGLMFTTSELKLSMLPHTRSHLLWHIALVRGTAYTACAFLAAMITGWLTPFTYSFAFYSAAVFSLFLILTMPLQWWLFSVSRWKKLFVFAAVSLFISGVRYITLYLELHGGWVGLFLGLLLLIWNLYLIPRSTQGVDWGRTVEVNDAKVWNLKIISHMTGVFIKPPKRYGVLHSFIRRRRAKQRFTHIHQLYHRLWRYHLHHQFTYVWKTILACAVIVTVLPVHTHWIMYLTLPIAVFVYIEVAAGLFADQFRKQPILGIIPIEEQGWLRTFYKWSAVGMSFLFILFAVVMINLHGLYAGLSLQLLGLGFWSLYDLQQRLRERISILQRTEKKGLEVLRLTGYVCLGAGVYFSPVIFGLILPPLAAKYREKLPFLRLSA